MEATATQDSIATAESVSRIQRLAWVIILVSFVMFCSFTIAFTGSIYYFLFRSTLPMDITMQVGRGSGVVTTADYQRPILSGATFNSLGDRPATIRNDNLSQSVLSFSLPTDDETPPNIFGTLTLKNDSAITLQNASRPRFGWSDGEYRVDFTDFSGEAEIYITQIPDRPIELRISTAPGDATIVIDTVGQYTINANESVVSITTYVGRALLVSPNNLNNRFAIAGEQAILLTGANLPVVRSAPVDLITNGHFTFDITPNPETGDLQIPQQWGCFVTFQGPPSGEYFGDTWNGRTAIRLLRESGNEEGKTGCSHLLDVPVEDYTRLELKTTFSINFQSLTNCGILGSECPLMIFIDYLDADGVEHTWYQGLFYNFDAQSPAPLVCVQCGTANEHRRVADKVWYTYESGNLLTRLPEDDRPVRITEVRFYASGHRYDVFVGDIALFAGSEQAIIPLENVPEDSDS